MLIKHELAEPFLYPIDSYVWPEYYQIIERPIDLTTIKGGLKDGTYSTVEGVLNDIRLIWANCRNFNAVGSEIIEQADTVSNYFEDLIVEKLTDELNKKPKEIKPKLGRPKKNSFYDEEDDENEVKKTKVKHNFSNIIEPTSLTKKVLKSIVSDLKKHEFSSPFLYPVNLEETPQYLDIIETPMDLSTVFDNVMALMYNNNIPLFLTHINLIFDNCIAYNAPKAPISFWANNLREQFNDTWRSVCEEDMQKNIDIQIKEKELLALAIENEKKNKKISDDSLITADIDEFKVINNDIDAKIVVIRDYNSIVNNLISGINALKEFKSFPDKDIQSTINTLTTNGLYDINIKDACHKEAKELTSNVTVPFFDKKTGHCEIISLGEIAVDDKKGKILSSYIANEGISPYGYQSKRSFRLYIVPNVVDNIDDENSYLISCPFITVNAISKIEGTLTPDGIPNYIITTDNHVPIGQGSTPDLAWVDTFNSKEKIVQVLSSKLKRCRAVFNRFCIDPDVVPFLEMIDIDHIKLNGIATDYYSLIKSPMWLREVHTRLVNGTYDCEFDFAWDVRLIFKNCMEYNKPESKLYKTSLRLLEFFEQLFCQWVLNIQDLSCSDIAKGEWDDWLYLRYFDSSPSPDQEDVVDEVHICMRSKIEYPEKQLMQCKYCEDEYHPQSLGLSKINPKFSCSRCTKAQKFSSLKLLDGVGPQGTYIIDENPYSKEKVDIDILCVYIPQSELGLGWSQAKRRKKNCLQNIFLSPLGYEVISKKDVALQIEYENKVNADLYLARENEFIEYLKKYQKENKKVTKKQITSPSRGRGRHHRRSAATSANFDESQVSTSSSNLIEIDDSSNELGIGSLVNYIVPSNCRFSMFIDVKEKNVINENLDISADSEVLRTLDNDIIHTPLWKELSIENIPANNLFGLDDESVCSCIEAMPKVGKFDSDIKYEFQFADRVYDAVIDELKNELDRRNSIVNIEAKIKEIVAKERWSIELNKIEREVDKIPIEEMEEEDEEIIENPNMNRFQSLFDNNITSEETKQVLAIWDFLEFISPISGELSISLNEVRNCINPPALNSINPEQIIFDEICSTLTSILFLEVENIKKKTNIISYNRFHLSKPLNIITWPYIAYDAIHCLTLPRADDEVAIFSFSNYITDNIKKQRDFMTLLFNHPCFRCYDGFLDIVSIRDNLLNNNILIYDSNIDLLNDVSRIISGALVENKVETPLYSISYELLCWINEVKNRFDAADLIIEFDIYAKPALSYQEATYIFNSTQYQEKIRDLKRYFELNPVTRSNHSIPAHIKKLQQQIGINFINPFDFGDEISRSKDIDNIYSIQLNQMNALDCTINLLSKSDPDLWNKTERLNILITLINICSETYCLKEFLPQKIHSEVKKQKSIIEVTKKSLNPFTDISSVVNDSNVISNQYTDISDVPRMPQKILPLETCKVKKYSDFTCSFTGANCKSCDSNEAWVYVPECFLSLVEIPSVVELDNVNEHNDVLMEINQPGNQKSRGRPKKGTKKHIEKQDKEIFRPVALERVILYMLSAREVALQKSENKLTEVISLTEAYFSKYDRQSSDCINIESILRPFKPYNRSIPLGYDRYGAEYWVFDALESSNVKQINDMIDSNANEWTPFNPAIIIKEFNGDWKFHNGRNMKNLLDNLSVSIKSEINLKENLLIRLLVAKSRMAINFRPKFQSIEWTSRIEETEKKVKRFQPDTIMDPIQLVKEQESHWARCVELRTLIHMYLLYKPADEPFKRNVTERTERDARQRKLKKLKESWVDDSYDHHPIKGFFRIDILNTLRELTTCTMATKIHADPSIYFEFQSLMKRSQVRIKFDEENLLNKKVSDEAMDITSPSEPSQIVINDDDYIDLISPTKNDLNDESNQYTIDQDQYVEMSNDNEIEPNELNDQPMSENDILQKKLAEVARKNQEREEYMRNAAYCNFKAVEMLHVTTGEVLRIYPSGKEAASFMRISQGGISLCCNDKQVEFCGYKWRFYCGPPIDFNAMADTQLTYEEVSQLSMRGIKRDATSVPVAILPSVVVKYQNQTSGNNFGGGDSARNSLSNITSTDNPEFSRMSTSITHTQLIKSHMLPSPGIAHIVLSNRVTSPRLTKLKGELISILYILPERRLKFKESIDGKDEDGDEENIKKQEIITNNEEKSEQELAIEKQAKALADKAERKKKRRAKRKLGMEKIISNIQNCTTAENLLEIVLDIEDLIPSAFTIDYDKNAMPLYGVTCSAVAMRIFSLDRALRYDKEEFTDKGIGPSNCTATKALQPRSMFTLRCLLSIQCGFFNGHGGKCNHINQSVIRSRTPEILDYVAPLYHEQNQINHNYEVNYVGNGPRGSYNKSKRYRDEDEEEEFIEMDGTKKRKNIVDIESVQPFNPPHYLISDIIWV